MSKVPPQKSSQELKPPAPKHPKSITCGQKSMLRSSSLKCSILFSKKGKEKKEQERKVYSIQC